VHRLGKAAYLKRYRGFKSHPLRLRHNVALEVGIRQIYLRYAEQFDEFDKFLNQKTQQGWVF
jgi:hypothetical protein